MTKTHSVRLGFIGIGLMGEPMCRRLLAAGYSLSVWNRSAEKCRALQLAGAHHAASIADLVERCDIILLCLADTAAVEHIALGPQGISSALSTQKIVVDFSSIHPQTTQKIAQEFLIKNSHWIDCPVSGGVVGAESGTLVMMAGGNPAVVETLKALLQTLAQRVTYMGDSGAGQTTKICNQLIVAANAVLIAEAVALAERAGVDAKKLAQALAGGFADSKPFQLLAPRMSEKKFEPVQWRVKTLLKDLRMANQLSASLTPPDHYVSLATHAEHLLQQHGLNGFSEHDLSSVILLFNEKK